MQYRELARTGLRVSEIGLGCEGFSGKTQAEAGDSLDTYGAGVGRGQCVHDGGIAGLSAL